MNEKAKLLRDFVRMHESYDGNCGGCLIFEERAKKKLTCYGYILTHSEKAVEIIEAWAKENPERTYMMDFAENYPQAKRDRDGLPCFCVQELGYIKSCPDIALKPCEECWNQPMDYSAPTIPELGKGGYVCRNGIAIVGEKGAELPHLGRTISGETVEES